MPEEFDVFLSHNSQDKPVVEEIARHLRGRGLRVWLDKDELRPGLPWQEGLEEGVRTSRSVAVFVGAVGLGAWQAPEMRAFLARSKKEEIPVIPVLLPSCPDSQQLTLFLESMTWVDLRPELTAEGLNRLVWGITGTKDENAKAVPAATGGSSPRLGHFEQGKISRPWWYRSLALALLGVLLPLAIWFWPRSPEPSPRPLGPPQESDLQKLSPKPDATGGSHTALASDNKTATIVGSPNANVVQGDNNTIEQNTTVYYPPGQKQERQEENQVKPFLNVAQFDPMVTAKKVIDEHIVKVKAVDLNGNGTAEEFLAISYSPRNSHTLYLLRPALGNYTKTFSVELVSLHEPTFYDISCSGAGKEDLLVASFSGGASTTAYDYVYVFYSDGLFRHLEFTIDYKSDILNEEPPSAINLPEEMLRDSFSARLGCIKSVLVENELLANKPSDMKKLGYVDTWIDENRRCIEDQGNLLNEGCRIKFIPIDLEKIQFNRLESKDGWILDFFDTTPTPLLGRDWSTRKKKTVAKFLTGGRSEKSCADTKDAISGKYFSAVKNFKSGVLGVDHERGKVFIMYYPIGGYGPSRVCIDGTVAYLDEIEKLETNYAKQLGEDVGFWKIDLKNAIISLVPGRLKEKLALGEFAQNIFSEY